MLTWLILRAATLACSWACARCDALYGAITLREYDARVRARRRVDLSWGGDIWTGKDFPF